MRIHYKILLTAFTLLNFQTVFNIVKAVPAQSLIVFVEDGQYKVKTDIRDEVVYVSDEASVTIQWAIDNIDNSGTKGGEVHIKKGEYLINNYLVLRDNIWLHGDGESTLLYANARIKSTILMQDLSMAVVSDLTLINKNNGLKSPIGIWIERCINCQVINVFIHDFTRGILHNGESCLTLINNNTFKNNTTSIDIMNGGGVIGRWLPVLVTENVITGGETGIYCNALCTNINKNTISATGGRAIVANANSIVVRENRISNVDGDFAIWGNGQEFNCTGNIISNVKGGGIRTRTRWGSISNNQIRNCGSNGNPSIAILVVNDVDKFEGMAESKVIYGNIIINDSNHNSLEYGIKEDGKFNVIMNNEIENVSKKKVKSAGEGTIIVPYKELN